MPIRRQDVLVLLLYRMAYSRVRNLLFRLQSKPVSRFVAFHDITGEAEKNFRRNLIFLKEKTNVVSLEDFMAGRLSSREVNVVITFDDGFRSWIESALPALRELQLPAIFFISAGLVGLTGTGGHGTFRSRLRLPQNGGDRDPASLSAAEVGKIAAAGFPIGGHTLNHVNMSKIDDIERLRYEISEDRKRLAEMTGREVEYFAYPEGACHNPAVNLPSLLRECGYKAAVTTKPGFNRAATDPYLLYRELTWAGMSPPVFRARVYGNYDAVRFLKERVWQRVAGGASPP